MFILKRAGLEHRKWLSNEIFITNIIDNTGTDNYNSFDGMRVFECNITKILGLYWNPNGDLLPYNVCEYIDKNTILFFGKFYLVLNFNIRKDQRIILFDFG